MLLICDDVCVYVIVLSGTPFFYLVLLFQIPRSTAKTARGGFVRQSCEGHISASESDLKTSNLLAESATL